jgi:hypothetical protein
MGQGDLKRRRTTHRLRQIDLQAPQRVERTINALRGFRAVGTRFDKRAYVVHGTVTVAAIRL